MRKLKLDLDELVVESFDTHAAASGRGTVQGQAQYTDPRICETNGCPIQTVAVTACVATCWGQYTCDGYFTCAYGDLENTCANTCDVFAAGCDKTYDNRDSCDGWGSCSCVGDNCW